MHNHEESLPGAETPSSAVAGLVYSQLKHQLPEILQEPTIHSSLQVKNREAWMEFTLVGSRGENIQMYEALWEPMKGFVEDIFSQAQTELSREFPGTELLELTFDDDARTIRISPIELT